CLLLAPLSPAGRGEKNRTISPGTCIGGPTKAESHRQPTTNVHQFKKSQNRKKEGPQVSPRKTCRQGNVKEREADTARTEGRAVRRWQAVLRPPAGWQAAPHLSPSIPGKSLML